LYDDQYTQRGQNKLKKLTGKKENLTPTETKDYIKTELLLAKQEIMLWKKLLTSRTLEESQRSEINSILDQIHPAYIHVANNLESKRGGTVVVIEIGLLGTRISR
jgi:5-bromo-4-chloroindolyl phosphate hydrolysis protein